MFDFPPPEKFNFPKPNVIKSLKERYPAGCIVELIQMNDKYAPPVGTLGKVICVDDLGTIHVKWDNGSTLGVAYGEDFCKVVEKGD